MGEALCITGLGAVTPLGVGAEVLYERWRAGECGIADGQAVCRDFDATEHLSRKEIRRTDRFAQMALVACSEAIAQAGWGEGLPAPAERIGCVIGTGIGGLKTIEESYDTIRDRGMNQIAPLATPMIMGNAAAVNIAIRYGLRGESFGVMSACASGSQGIAAGLRLLRSGELDALVVGGAEACTTKIALGSFAVTGATSRLGISRPFDRRRDGFVLGEGAGILLVERAEIARARKAEVLGEFLGHGASSDAFHVTAPSPDGGGAAAAIASALVNSGLEPADISYINAHGTSTELNDRSETLAIKKAMGPRAHEIPVTSTKSAIGHLVGAAGAVEAIATLLALRNRVAPPTLGLEFPEEGLDLNYSPRTPTPLKDRGEAWRPIALSNSFGFGGHNSVLAIRAWPATDGAIDG